VDGQGVPVGLAVEGANRNDMKPVRATLESIPVEFGFTAHITARGEEAKEIKRSARKKARHWVVERTHSWMNCFRGILIRWNKKPENYIALLHFSFAIIAYRASGLFG
jgi:hypothetical protein